MNREAKRVLENMFFLLHSRVAASIYTFSSRVHMIVFQVVTAGS
jgi:hypothetical protein